MTGWLQSLYVTPTETRELGYILTEHFGRNPGRSIHMDLTGVSQRWLRDLIWDHLVAILRSPSCPRSGGTFDDMRRAGLELSTFLELHAPAGDVSARRASMTSPARMLGAIDQPSTGVSGCRSRRRGRATTHRPGCT